MAASAADLIPADLVRTLEAGAGAKIVTVVPRGGGGASRRGAVVTLRDATGERGAYLSFDTRAGDAKRKPFFERETAILGALSGPLAGAGVPAPKLIASDANHLALLTSLVSGADRFGEVRDKAAVARNYMVQIAALHAIDTAKAPLAGFGDAKQPTSERIRQRIAQLLDDNLSRAPDPLLVLALEWLRENIPPDAGPSVIVHGDAGPGNFLHENDRVTGLLDWELCHYGDPMEDLAGIWVRSMIQPFVPMRDVFAAYESASGKPVDVDRVRYHRLFFQLGFMAASHASFYGASGTRPPMLGMSVLYYTLHMGSIARSLGELTGQALAPVDLPERDASFADRSYEIALDDLRAITTKLGDQEAQTQAKSLARLVKWWRARERYAALFEQAELDEIAQAIGVKDEDLLSARAALARRILDGGVDKRVALDLCHRRMARETHIMGDAMGGLKNGYFPPLDPV